MAKQTSTKQTTSKSVQSSVPVILENLIPESLARKIFVALSVLLVVAMAYMSKDYGITGDENFHRVYGHHVLDFYTSFGKDLTSTQPYGDPDSLMRYYGGFYDGTAAALHKVAPGVNEWTLRHVWNSVFASTAMIFAALVAVEIAGWQAGLITLIFMMFSPRFFGEGMNNPKDITMATGYVISYVFILRFLKQLPTPKLSTALGLSLAIGIALGIRIGGLLLIPYLFLFYGLSMWQRYGLSHLLNSSNFKQDVWPSLRYALLAAGLGYFIGLFFWPYGLIGPFSNPFETLSVSSKFPATIRMLFDGKMIMSTEIPWYYIPKWIYITAPLFALLGLVASAFIIPAYRKQGKLLLLGFVYFTLAFPIFYIIYKKAVLYDGMRHMYFVYPSIVILAGLAFDYFLKAASKQVKYATLALMLVLVALPARFMVANHPNEAVYFNELIGGIKGAYGNYETDYYMNSVKQCEQWLRKNVEIKPRPDGSRMIFYSNAVGPVGNYFIDDTAKLACGYTSYRTRFEKDGDYFILYQRFVDRQLLMNGCFPPEQAVFTVEVDGVPVACVVKKTDNRDFLGIDAVKKNDFVTAVKYLEPYAAKYPKNEGVWTNLGLAYLNLSRPDDAIRALNQGLQLNNENLNALYYMAMAYQMKGDMSSAQYYNSILQQLQQ